MEDTKISNTLELLPAAVANPSEIKESTQKESEHFQEFQKIILDLNELSLDGGDDDSGGDPSLIQNASQ